MDTMSNWIKPTTGITISSWTPPLSWNLAERWSRSNFDQPRTEHDPQGLAAGVARCSLLAAGAFVASSLQVQCHGSLYPILLL